MTNTRLHRSRVQGTGVDASLNGAEAIKAGESPHGGDLRNNLVDHCWIADVLDERETISIKEGGLTLFRVTFSNTKDISARHAVAACIEECVGMRDITLSGPDHLVVNSEVENRIELWSGSFDGATAYDDIPGGDGDIYLSSVDNRVEHSVGPLVIGEESVQGAEFGAVGARVSEHTGAVSTENGATFEEVEPEFAAVRPQRIEPEETGLAGYIDCMRP